MFSSQSNNRKEKQNKAEVVGQPKNRNQRNQHSSAARNLTLTLSLIL